MSKTVYLDAPNVGRLEKKYLSTAIDTGFVSTIGPFVQEFEGAFAAYMGVRKAVSTQSGTAALHAVLHELGVGRGDEVIVPVLTFIATVTPITQLGAKPVFVDIDPETWTIDVGCIEKKITKKTKAIIPVHLYGNPCKMDDILRLARNYRLHIIEDATESLGASYEGKPTGTFGEFGCFSFNGNKIMTTGGGGMIVGKSDRRIAHLKFLVNQARDESKGYYHPEVGFNYRMTNIEASLGLAQLQRLPAFLTIKKRFYDTYTDELRKHPSVRFQKEYPSGHSSWWLPCVLWEGSFSIARVQQVLKEMNIQSRRAFMPITEFPPYKERTVALYPNAAYVYEHALCLPASTLNSTADIRRAAKILRSI